MAAEVRCLRRAWCGVRWDRVMTECVTMDVAEDESVSRLRARMDLVWFGLVWDGALRIPAAHAP